MVSFCARPFYEIVDFVLYHNLISGEKLQLQLWMEIDFLDISCSKTEPLDFFLHCLYFCKWVSHVSILERYIWYLESVIDVLLMCLEFQMVSLVFGWCIWCVLGIKDGAFYVFFDNFGIWDGLLNLGIFGI